jgi:protein-S-isoprenylcysteine O-methyltransferase Ste14
LLIPLFIFLGFVYFNIPALDSYLKQRYGAEFDEWRRRTRKFVPFVY